MQRLEYENGQLNGNTLANWKPMELPENWTSANVDIGDDQ